ncbi:MAG: HEAT repeat domain-containing protein [Elusimicrobiota bacterium]
MDPITGKENIEEKINTLLDPKGRKKETILYELALIDDNESFEYVKAVLTGKGTLEARYWYIRYLCRVPGYYAIEALAELAEDPKESIRREAREGIKRLEKDAFSLMLKKLVYSQNRDNMAFALREIYYSGDVRFVIPVYRVFGRLSLDEELAVTAVKCISMARVPRSRAILKEIAIGYKSPGIRKEAIKALSEFRKLDVSFFKDFLADDNNEIRRIAAAALHTRVTKKSQRALSLMIKAEKNKPEKLYMISGIKMVISRPLFSVLWEYALAGEMEYSMAAFSVLRRTRTGFLEKRIISILKKSGDIQERAACARILADYNTSGTVKALIKLFEKSASFLEKNGILETLSGFKSFSSAFLRSQSAKGGILGKSAFRLLLGQKAFSVKELSDMLNRQNDQYIVKEILSYAANTWNLPGIEGLIDKFALFTSSRDIHIRYLSFAALINNAAGKSALHLFSVLRKEKDRLLKNEFVSLFAADINGPGMDAVLSEYSHNTGALSVISKIIKRLPNDADRGFIDAILKNLGEESLDPGSITALKKQVLLRQYLVCRKELIDYALKEADRSHKMNHITGLLMNMSSDIARYSSPEALAEFYVKNAMEVKKAVLHIMSFYSGYHKKFSKIILDDYNGAESAVLSSAIREYLSGVFAKAAQAPGGVVKQ